MCIKYIDSQCNEDSLLLIDNCSAHLLDYDNLNLRYIKKKYDICILQPCDAEIIKNFKNHYRNLFI
jgi:hypothetical protein